VVAAILVVLAALLFPALGRAKARAGRTACTGNLRQISLGVRLYADDSEDVSPGVKTNALDPFTAYKQLMKNYVGLEELAETGRRVQPTKVSHPETFGPL